MTIFYQTSTNSFYIESLTHIWRFLHIIQNHWVLWDKTVKCLSNRNHFKSASILDQEGRKEGLIEKGPTSNGVTLCRTVQEFTDTTFYHSSEICNIPVKFTERQIFTQARLIYKLHNNLAIHMVASGQTIDFFEWRATKVIQQKAYLSLSSLFLRSLSPSFYHTDWRVVTLTSIIKWSQNMDERWWLQVSKMCYSVLCDDIARNVKQLP